MGSGISCFINDIDYNGISKWKVKRKIIYKYGSIEKEKCLISAVNYLYFISVVKSIAMFFCQII